MSIDGGTSQPVIGESCDPSANHLVRFSDQNPSTTSTKKLVLKNMRFVLQSHSTHVLSWSLET
jgi:hypothetical protein